MASDQIEDLIKNFSSIQLNNFPSAKIKIDELFIEWLKVEGVNSPTLETLASIGSSEFDSLTSLSKYPPKLLSQLERSQNGSPPSHPINIAKKSPKKRTQSEMLSAMTKTDQNEKNIASIISVEAKKDDDDEVDENQLTRRRANFDSIPIFYFPGKKNHYLKKISEDDQLARKKPEIEAFFRSYPGGIPVEKFVHVTKRLCGIPSFFNMPLCRRILELFGDAESGSLAPRVVGRASRQPSGVKIKLNVFLKFWSNEIEPFDKIERFFRVIKRPDAEYIHKDDFVPFLQELLHFHPGLDFLDAHEEFQRKYALTVITRIFYKVNTSRSGRLCLREVRKSDLFQACMHVDEETDINRVVDYFSYEHFYVLYCKFFELDMDKDSKITKNDLLRYGEHSLSGSIVDRIFQVGPRVFADGIQGGMETTGMTYPDFIYFMLSEEDKTSICSLRYWFTCCDLDGDGTLSPQEMNHFYKNQIMRITSLGQESIHFEDVLCQMVDMIKPVNSQAITLQDLLKPDKRMISGTLFDVLFNLHKFMRFESRDPFQEKLRREDIHHSDWDRYAHIEYNRLAQEEDGYDEGTMEVDQSQMNNLDNAITGAASPGEAGQGWNISDESDDDEDDVVAYQQQNNKWR